jgi:hypothetical protein
MTLSLMSCIEVFFYKNKNKNHTEFFIFDSLIEHNTLDSIFQKNTSLGPLKNS